MDIPTDDRHNRVNEYNHKIKKHLYWTLFFLHNYPIQDNMEVIFQKDHKPLMKWIWCVIYIINLAVNRGRPSPLPPLNYACSTKIDSADKNLSADKIYAFAWGKSIQQHTAAAELERFWFKKGMNYIHK